MNEPKINTLTLCKFLDNVKKTKQNRTKTKQKQKTKTDNKKKNNNNNNKKQQYYDKSHILLMAHTRLWQLVNNIFQQCNIYDSNF